MICCNDVSTRWLRLWKQPVRMAGVTDRPIHLAATDGPQRPRVHRPRQRPHHRQPGRLLHVRGPDAGYLRTGGCTAKPLPLGEHWDKVSIYIQEKKYFKLGLNFPIPMQSIFRYCFCGWAGGGDRGWGVEERWIGWVDVERWMVVKREVVGFGKGLCFLGYFGLLGFILMD